MIQSIAIIKCSYLKLIIIIIKLLNDMLTISSRINDKQRYGDDLKLNKKLLNSKSRIEKDNMKTRK